MTDLKTFRGERQWTQERLAEELGVTKSTVSRWECELFEPRPYIKHALERLAEQYPPASTNEAAA